MKVIKIIWEYIRNSWEDDRKHLSYKRVSQFIFTWLLVFMILKDRVQNQWSFYAFLTIAVLFALTATIITVPQLIRLVKEYSAGRNGSGVTTTTTTKLDQEQAAEDPKAITENDLNKE